MGGFLIADWLFRAQRWRVMVPSSSQNPLTQPYKLLYACPASCWRGTQTKVAEREI